MKCLSQVVQRRSGDLPTFNVPLNTYRHSFGDQTRERMDFWLGNEHVQQLTKGKRFQLRFEMTFAGDLREVVEFGGFTLELTEQMCSMRLSMYSGRCFT